jgi:ATP-dependent protease ClpP protease subunit
MAGTKGEIGRRAALLALGAASVPAIGRAQTPTLPTPPVLPPANPPAVVVPAPQPAAPAASSAIPPRPPPVATTGVDRTKAYYVFFDQAIDVLSARRLRQQLANLVDGGVSEITLVIDSAGGQLDPTVFTYGFIRALPAKINTHAQSFVQSAATVLFLAGQERSADRNARFVFHPPQATALAGTVAESQMRERLSALQTVTEVMEDVYRDRTTLTQAEIDRFGREMVVYTADKALAAGLIHSVGDLRIPGEGKAKIILLD